MRLILAIIAACAAVYAIADPKGFGRIPGQIVSGFQDGMKGGSL